MGLTDRPGCITEGENVSEKGDLPQKLDNIDLPIDKVDTDLQQNLEEGGEESKATLFQTYLNLFKSFIGIGILATPAGI